MTLHVIGAIPVWIILLLLVVRLWIVRTQSASVTWLMVCCGFVAVGLTLNEPVVTGVLGDATRVPNIADLIGRCLMVCGLFALAQSVQAAAQRDRRLRPTRLLFGGLVLAALGVLFSMIHAPVATDDFMRVYGGQLATGLYSAVEMAYVAYVVATSAVAVLAEFRHGRGPDRVYWLFVIGAIGMTLLAATAISLDAVHVFNLSQAVSTLSAIYNPLFIASMILLATGASGGAFSSAVREIRAWRETRGRIAELEPSLHELEKAAGREGLYFRTPYRRNEWRSRWHRLVLEIEDRSREAGRLIPEAAQIDVPEKMMEKVR